MSLDSLPADGVANLSLASSTGPLFVVGLVSPVVQPERQELVSARPTTKGGQTVDKGGHFAASGLDHYFLTPEDNVRLALTRFEDWLSRSVAGQSTPQPKGDRHETDDRSRPRRLG